MPAAPARGRRLAGVLAFGHAAAGGQGGRRWRRRAPLANVVEVTGAPRRACARQRWLSGVVDKNRRTTMGSRQDRGCACSAASTCFFFLLQAKRAGGAGLDLGERYSGAAGQCMRAEPDGSSHLDAHRTHCSARYSLLENELASWAYAPSHQASHKDERPMGSMSTSRHCHKPSGERPRTSHSSARHAVPVRRSATRTPRRPTGAARRPPAPRPPAENCRATALAAWTAECCVAPDVCVCERSRCIRRVELNSLSRSAEGHDTHLPATPSCRLKRGQRSPFRSLGRRIAQPAQHEHPLKKGAAPIRPSLSVRVSYIDRYACKPNDCKASIDIDATPCAARIYATLFIANRMRQQVSTAFRNPRRLSKHAWSLSLSWLQGPIRIGHRIERTVIVRSRPAPQAQRRRWCGRMAWRPSRRCRSEAFRQLGSNHKPVRSHYDGDFAHVTFSSP